MEDFAVKVNEDNVQKVLQKMEDRGYVWKMGQKPTEFGTVLYGFIIVRDKILTQTFSNPVCPTILSAEQFLEFTLSDLETGHVVTLRDGTKMVVYKDTALNTLPDRSFLVSDSDEWRELNRKYHEDLKHITCDLFDIMKVERPVYIIDLGTTNARDAEVVYERIKPKEMTLAEIEKELGYKIKLVEES